MSKFSVGDKVRVKTPCRFGPDQAGSIGMVIYVFENEEGILPVRVEFSNTKSNLPINVYADCDLEFYSVGIEDGRPYLEAITGEI